jgi:hypothetical protein
MVGVESIGTRRCCSTAERLTITAARSNHGCRPFYVEGRFGPKSSPEKTEDAEVREPLQNCRHRPQDSLRADPSAQGPITTRKPGSEVAVRGVRIRVRGHLRDMIQAELGNLGRLESVLRCLAHSMEYQSSDDHELPYYPDIAEVACDLLKRSLADLDVLYDGYIPNPLLAGRKIELL